MKSGVLMIGFAAAILFAFAPGSVHAKSKKFTVVCVEKNNTSVDHTATVMSASPNQMEQARRQQKQRWALLIRNYRLEARQPRP